jgi:tripartite-type tricarboxylate transporter receptor subunit TctC
MKRFHSTARRHALAALLACTVTPFTPAVMAQNDFPSKPIKIVIGFPAGGSVDQVGRVVGDALGQRLKGVVVIDNQGGAAGAIAAQRLVTSPADGYTLLVGSSNELAATKQVNPAQRYDAAKDMTPIGLIATAPVVLVAGPKAGVKTLAEMIDAAKRQPGKFSYGSSGVGSTLHFAGELLKQRAGIFMTHIPYRGVAPLTADLAGGTLDLAVVSPTGALPFIQSGRITPLAVSSAKRLAALPDVPAMGENPLLKGYELVGWFALMAPRNLPPEVTQRLATALQETLQDPAVRKKLIDSGMEVATGREDLGKLIADESAKFAKLVTFANMRE